jgi:hypothetical protein
MAKLCPKGKAAAKRKFKVYPSAYANMYASAVCSGKVTPGGKKKRKKAFNGGSIDRDPPKKESSKTVTKTKANLRRDLKNTRTNAMGGGMMTQPRVMYGKGGGVCIRGMNRDAIGKNS